LFSYNYFCCCCCCWWWHWCSWTQISDDEERQRSKLNLDN